MRQSSITFVLLQSIALVTLTLGCDESSNSTTTSGGGGKDGSGGASSVSSGVGGAGTSSSGAGGAGGAAPCSVATLADAVRVTTVTIDGASLGRAITAETEAGSVVAWAGSDGKVHVTPLDAEDQRSGTDLLVDGSNVFGVAAGKDDIALLVSRGTDFMTFVRIDTKGTVLATSDLVGGGDHNTIGVEWFGEFAQTGRLVARGDGTYAAYHALHRRWPDMIGHQGDTLRLLDSAGKPVGGGWDWGCSHSLDQRLAMGPNGVVPVCVSDCYPQKGIWFNHQGSQITMDPAANCAGQASTTLGGLVAVQSGFFLVYKDADGAAHLGSFDAGGALVVDRVIAKEGSSRLARYDGGMLMGSVDGGGAALQRLDAAGQDVGGPTTITMQLPEQDFEGRSDEEVAWAQASGMSLNVVRVRVCK